MEKTQGKKVEIISIYNELIDKLLDEPKSKERTMHIAKAIKDLFYADRVALINIDKDQEIIALSECKEDSLPDFNIELWNETFITSGKLYELISNEMKVSYILSKDLDEKSQIKKVLDKLHINNFAIIVWKSAGEDRILFIENIRRELSEEAYYGLYKLIKFSLTAITNNEALYKLANIDSLTKLHNRNHYTNMIDSYTRIPPKTLGIIFLDVDNLKIINDNYGHLLGDRKLVKLAKTLRKVYRRADVCRIGGDEFVVFLPECTYKDYVLLNKQLLEELNLANVECSFGSCFRSENIKVTEMIERAEKDMYYFKKIHHDLNDRCADKLFLSVDEKDINERMFLPVYQPQFSLKTRELIGIEAFARGLAPDGSLVDPCDFIPNLERNDCIDVLDYFMIEECCIMANHFSVPILCNVSYKTLLKESFVDDMKAMFKKYDVPHDRIRFEISEKVEQAIADIKLKTMRMNSFGFVIIFDNATANFINLTLLDREIFSSIKIDIALAKQMMRSPVIGSFLDTLIKYCRELGLTIVVKNIETEDDLNAVSLLDVDEVQGYYFERPMRLENLVEKYGKINKCVN